MAIAVAGTDRLVVSAVGRCDTSVFEMRATGPSGLPIIHGLPLLLSSFIIQNSQFSLRPLSFAEHKDKNRLCASPAK